VDTPPTTPDVIKDLGLDKPTTPFDPSTPEEGSVVPPEVSADPKAAHAWAEIKRENKDLKAQIAASTSSDDMTAMQAKVDSYETQLGQLDLASTNSFKEKFDNPMKALGARAGNILRNAGIEEADVGALVGKVFGAAPAQMETILEDLSPAIQGAMITLVSEFQERGATRESALNTWKESKAALSDQESRTQEASFKEMASKDLGTALEQSLAEGNWMFRKSGTDAEWDTEVDNRQDIVKGIIQTAEPAEIIKWVIEGVTAKPLRDLFAKEQAKGKQLLSELTKALGGTPQLGADGVVIPAAPVAEGVNPVGTPVNPRDVVKNLLANL
jgi:hypothetical protein